MIIGTTYATLAAGFNCSKEEVVGTVSHVYTPVKDLFVEVYISQRKLC